MHNFITPSSHPSSSVSPGVTSDNPVGVPFSRESAAIIGQGPITPPTSPGNGEDDAANAMALDKEESMRYPSEQVERPPLIIQTSTPLWRPHVPVMIPQPSSPPKRPARLLEDEAVHVERRGVLRLPDFEVKGALGLWLCLPEINDLSLVIWQALVPLAEYS